MLTQIAAHLDARRRVERRERFVQQEEPGFERQRAPERHALGLAAGQLRWPQVGQLVQPEAREPLTGPAQCCRPPRAAAAQTERDVLDHAHPVEQQPILEHDTDRAPPGRNEQRRGGIVEHLAVELDPTGVDGLQTGVRPEQRGLARAVGTDEHDELARRRRQRHVEIELAQLHLHAAVQPARFGFAHGTGVGSWPRADNTRLPTNASISTETATSTMLSTMPAGSLFSNAR